MEKFYSMACADGIAVLASAHALRDVLLQTKEQKEQYNELLKQYTKKIAEGFAKELNLSEESIEKVISMIDVSKEK